MSISVRPASLCEADAIANLLRNSITDLCVADHKSDAQTLSAWLANKTAAHIQQWFNNQVIYICVGVVEGSLAGVGGSHPCGEILLNYVAPGYRFRGVSKVVLAHLEARLVAQGVTAGTLVSTETARAFYRGQGWREAGAPEYVFGLAGYPMEKKFGAKAN